MQIFCISSYEVCAPGRVEYAKIIFHHETDNRTTKIDDAIGTFGQRIKRCLKSNGMLRLGTVDSRTIRHSKPARAFLFNHLSRVYQHLSVLIIDMCLCSLAIGNTFSVLTFTTTQVNSTWCENGINGSSSSCMYCRWSKINWMWDVIT